jgi:quaternary ammonium compound-resistance protein SugE
VTKYALLDRTGCGDDLASVEIRLMAWFYLIVAGVFEVAWAIGLRYTQGFTRFWPSVLTSLAIVVSMALLALAVKTIPIGTAYAVWTGIGVVGTAILGVFLFDESVSASRVVFVTLIVTGIIGLKITTPELSS